MRKKFNINGACRPDRHYMVDPASRLAAVKEMVDAGEYFVINKARQYGKTTLLRALSGYLKNEYLVVSMDFQRMSAMKFRSEAVFAAAFAQDFVLKMKQGNPGSESILQPLEFAAGTGGDSFGLYELFRHLSEICGNAKKPVVLLIDEVDTASNNQVFLDFLAQLRAYYLDSDITPTFQSVILAGVYDIRNMRSKIRPEEEHKQNSPWNIAAKFRVDMSFSAEEIAGMLADYEADQMTGMDVGGIAELLWEYTDGYPYLVSALCKSIDEEIAGTDAYPDLASAWSRAGVSEAVKRFLSEANPLFESLIGRLEEYPELKNRIQLLLFSGQDIAYNADDPAAARLLMFGFVKVENGTLQIANRIFETRLYNYFLAQPEEQDGSLYRLALRGRNQFITAGRLDMERVLKKFVEYFDDIYGDRDEKFLEEDGRRFFMLYLKPIINGAGNYYVEARTRNQERTDLIVDYCGEQYIVEMKIWRGNTYNERGEEQLAAYLDHYHLKKGYLLSFNFNKNKQVGVRKITIGDKVLVEAVV